VALDPENGGGRPAMRRVTQKCVGATHESTHFAAAVMHFL
jgi:hypothetical protein